MMIGDQPESSCCAKRWKSDGLGCFSFFLLDADDDAVEAAPALPGSAPPRLLPPLPPFTAATVERLVGAELAAAPLPLGSMDARTRERQKHRKERSQKKGSICVRQGRRVEGKKKKREKLDHGRQRPPQNRTRSSSDSNSWKRLFF